MFPEPATIASPSRSPTILNIVVGQPALQNFTINRSDNESDGHIGRIVISPRESPREGLTSYLIEFADNDRSETSRTEFKFVDLASLGDLANRESVGQGGLQGTATVNARSPRPDQTALLAGFSFTRDGGGDHHMREIAIIPSAGSYSVAFRDDSPNDDTYSAVINPVFVPNANIVSRHSERFEDVIGSLDVPREPGQAALRGFSFKYLNSDHHIRKLEVKLSGNRIRMSMCDDNPNRHFQATVDYAILQE